MGRQREELVVTFRADGSGWCKDAVRQPRFLLLDSMG
jgi:hypothetical protein